VAAGAVSVLNINGTLHGEEIGMMDVDENDGANGTTREDLVQRVALMEAMIAEGRQATGRYGWNFVLWGLVDIVGLVWQSAKPHWWGAWPIAITVGVVLQIVGVRIFYCRATTTLKNRTLRSIWQVMGVTMCLYCFSGALAHRANGIAYLAAVFMMLGMAHSISAVILRWGVQGGVGALWLGGGVACYFVPGRWLNWLFLIEMVVGMVVFGLYAMMLERRRARQAPVMRHG
jgi:hypothetical protein